MGNGLFIQQLGENPTYFFAVIISVIISITLHELAHGWVAIRNGDDTPIVTGHMTLNPLVHMGGFSLILLAIAGIAFGAMPINPSRLRGKYAESRVALAGPAMNLILGVAAIIAMALWLRYGTVPEEVGPASKGFFLLSVFGQLNIALMLFNLLPIPPLDGSRVAENIIPAYRRLMSNPTMQGVSTALFFAVFIGAGFIIWRAADFLTIAIIAGIFKLLGTP